MIKIESPVVARELLARYSGLGGLVLNVLCLPEVCDQGCSSQEGENWVNDFSWVKVEKRRLENSLNICAHILYFALLGVLEVTEFNLSSG